jgi:predicted amidohydrolase YtcJ
MTTMLVTNGPIYTLDPAKPLVEALGIRNGIVCAVGSRADVLAILGTPDSTLDLQGKAAIPGLTDAHVHIIATGMTLRQVSLYGATDFAAVCKTIGAAADRLPAGVWLQGGGWDHTLWGGYWPTADDLEKLCPGRPALLSRKDGHSAWVNHTAMKIAGIDRHTADPEGGHIDRDANGNPTGIFKETAINLVRQHIPDTTDEDRRTAVSDAFAEGYTYGMVGMHSLTGTRRDGFNDLRNFQYMREHGKLPGRILVQMDPDGFEHMLGLGLRSGLGDDWLRIGAFKFFADGTLGSETADMLAPFEGGTNLGLPTMSREEIFDNARRANQNGIAISVHCIGDGSNRKVLDAIEAALKPMQQPGESLAATAKRSLALPNRIEHCQLLDPTDIPRFAAMNVVASMQPVHMIGDLDTADRLWGKRNATSYAWRSVELTGAVLALGSDAPVESLNPWLSIYGAVTRRKLDGTPAAGWYPEQALTRLSTLRGFTVGAAYCSNSHTRQGTLMPGMVADLAVMKHDPFACDAAQLQHNTAHLTMIEGTVVYRNDF